MYILITPAKNEEKALRDVADSVIRQTIKPKLWVIVDDGSTDNTPLIIKNLESKYKWIRSIRLPQRARDITFHYAYVCKSGFDYAIEYCERNTIDYEFVGLLDADTILEEKYFEKLINKFKKDKNLGIASGGVYYNNINKKLQGDKTNENLPRGTGRLWVKDCFLDTGGYQVERSPDSISNVKAVLHGWKIKQFKHIIAIQSRMTSSAEGLWTGYKINGKTAYYLNKHPLLVFLSIIHFTTKKPYYIGIAFLYGYLKSVFKRKEKIDDEEIRDYYWNTRLKEYKNVLVKKLKGR
jgi:glycosyltransferase involved in cell wall biosynthesis